MTPLSFLTALFVVTFSYSACLAKTLAAAEDKTLKVAITDWCPQLCPHSGQKGYIRDIFDAVYAKENIRFEFVAFPWSRAIHTTRKGATIALLSPAKDEAPGLHYPGRPIGYQQMCFFTLKSHRWQYSGISSLTKARIGVAINTSIPGLDDYIRLNLDAFELKPYSDSYFITNIRMLAAKRIDAFLLTRNTTLHEMKKMGRDKDHRIAGCLKRSFVYVGFTPAASRQEEVLWLSAIFDRRMAELTSSGKVAEIMSTYGVTFD